jgi:subtilisin-like proprotein convertase family protein
MRSRRPIWILLSLLLLAGAWFFWHQENRAAVQKKSAAKPAVVTVHPASTAPKFLMAQALSKNSSTNNASTTSTNKFAYRLSNTTKPIGELVHDEKAILLANALIDLRNPLNFSIPKNLQAQGDPGAYIVQANGPIDSAFRAMLASAGATVVSYIPNDAYLVRASSGVANGIAADGFSVIPYEPYYKVQSALLPFDEKQLPGGTALNLGLFGDDAAATIQQIKKLGGQILSQDSSPFGPIVRVLPPANNWTALAQLPGVQIVEPYRQRVEANDLSRVTTGVSTDSTNDVYYTNGIPLTGNNVLVEENDSGIDATHPDLTGRVFGDATDLTDTDGHGTHVAGIIAGDGTESATVTNAEGSINPGVTGQYRGMAPKADLFIQDLNNSDATLQETPALTNALISNNSWVYDGNSSYDLAAASYDAATRDALPGLTGSQPVLFVFAAGNDGNGDDSSDPGGGQPDTIQSPATAKDVITVGALQEFRNITNEVTNADGTVTPVWQPETSTSYRVAGFSSRGNVGIGTEGTYGRYKPDVVAPGTFIVSTRSSQWDVDTYFYQDPTNYDLQEFDNIVVQPDSLWPNGFPELPNSTIQATIQVEPNADSPDPFPSMPIYVGLLSSAGYDFDTTNNEVLILGSPEAPANYLNEIFGSQSFGVGFDYGISNTTSEPISFDLITDVITTNNPGNYFLVLSNLDDALGGPPYYYRYESGTSMAAPAVSGVLALMQGFFTNQWHTQPSPALLKAMLINGARATGFYNFQAQNSINYEGWGLINLPDSLPPGIATNGAAPNVSMFIQDQSPTNALATGDSQTFNVTLNTNALAQPLRVTLAWTDPPGNPVAATKLVNDLNLVVSNRDNPSIVYYGNDIPASSTYNSARSTNSPPVFDDINNVENVYLPEGIGTNFSVTVVGYRVNVNAVTAQTNNSVGAYAPNVVQDYALVISSGDGTVTNAMTVMANPIVSNPTTDQQITGVTNSNGGVLLNQTVGANTPLLGTNTLLFSSPSPENLGTNWQVTLGMTNQWHFYVVTNPPSNSSDFTNAAFITFDPATLSIPRTGVFADSQADATRPEADIDLYVAGPNDPNAASLTNLNPTVISNCVYGLNGDGASLGRGGTEFVAYSNSTPGQIYYVGVKSEDQMASEYGFLSVFTSQPFSVLNNGVETVNGLLLPVNIPDGSPAHPGIGLVFALAIYPIDVGSVVVSNTITHQNFGDLIGTLNHNDISDVLNNHDSLGNPPGPYSFIYDDSRSGQYPGSQPSDGPGSLNNFIGTQGIGPWILNEVDDSLTQTGSVQQFSLQIQPHQPIDNSHTNTVQPNSWFYDYVDVPPGATNLTVTVTNLTAATPPLELFVKYGALPATNSFDEMTLITNVDTLGLDGSISIGAPLTSGRYYFGVYNPSATAQTFISYATYGVGFVPTPFDFTSGGPATILDDAVTTNSIFVSPGGTISSVNVGLVVDDPRISDLVFHLISPDGTRVLLMENRGGVTADGAGGTIYTTNTTVTPLDIENLPAGNYTGPIANGWTVTSNQVSVVDDPATAYAGSSNFLALANGVILTNLPTVAGQTYTLSFAYRGPGIVGLWRGENNYNDSIYGNTGIGQDINFTPGEVGNAFVSTYTANPPQSAISIPDQPIFALTNSLSIDGWIKSAGVTGNNGEILWRGDDRSGYDPYFFQLNGDNTLGFGIGNNAGVGVNLNTTFSLPINQWFHVAATLDGNTGTMSIYTNGVLAAQTSTTIRPDVVLLAGDEPSLGIANTGTPVWEYIPFNGDLDEISLYSRALSASEIKAIYNAASAGKFDAASTFPQNLAKAEISIPGIAPTTLFGNNTNWQTTNITFTATTNETPLQITGLEPGMLLSAMTLTNIQITAQYQYLTFTEDTNLTTTPIKFAVPPFNGSSQAVTDAVVMSDGFDNAVAAGGADPNRAYGVGQYVDGWLVESNDVDVCDNGWGFIGNIADSPPNCLDLSGNDAGIISTNFSTVVGQSYALSFAYTKNPGGVTASANVSAGSQNFQITYGGPNSSTALNWAHTSVVFTATSPTTTLRFISLNSGVAGMFLDSVKVSALSFPSIYYLPEQSLDAFTGENSFGNWLLEIQDDRAGAGLTNTLESWQLQFTYTTATTSLTNSQTATNSLQPGGIVYYLVNVPTNADFATNSLFTSSGPLNFWFDESTPPSGTNSPGDYLLFSTSVNDSNVLSRTSSPTNIVSGGTYYLAVQNTNTFAVTNFSVQVNFHLFTVTNLVGGQPQTNTVDPGSFAYYAVSVPTNADIATNILQFATGGPVNLLFNQTTLPTGLGAGDFTLLSASTGGSTNLTLAGTPPLVPGATYYLGVQNTNAVPVTFGIEVDFHLIPTSPITNYPISGIVYTNIGGTNGILLTWYAPTNYQFQIQWTRSLSPSPISWTTVPGVTPTLVSVTGTTGTYQWFDDFSLTGGFGTQKFYRLIAYPPGVPVPPFLIISSVQAFPGGGIQLQWLGSTNYLYDILWTSNLALAKSNWNVLSNLTSPTLTYAGGVFTFSDPTGALTGGAAAVKFFQVLELP